MTSTKDLLKTDRRKVREYWNKSDAQVEMEIEIIKTWLETQKHLPEIPCDNTIEFTLINCKFSIEKTKKVLDMYYTVPHLLPELYENKHPCLEHMKEVQKTLCICPLPQLTDSLHRISILKYKPSDPDELIAENMYASLLRNFFEIKSKEDLCLGEIFIVDFGHLKFGHVIKFTPMLTKKGVFVLENVWANRLTEMHFINCPTYIDRIMFLVRTLMSKKLQERVFIHSKLEDLYKAVPKHLLPSDYGGEESSTDELEKLWDRKMEEYKDRFDEMENLKVNEVLRPEKLENSDILGYHGNFKTIEVD